MTLTLNADGTMVLFDGCNTHSGTWSGPINEIIDFEDTISTEKGCPEGVVVWFAPPDGAIVEGDALTLLLPNDEPAGDLVRSEE